MEMIGYLLSGLGLSLIGPTIRQHKKNVKDNSDAKDIAEGFLWIGGVIFMTLIGLVFVFATPVAER